MHQEEWIDGSTKLMAQWNLSVDTDQPHIKIFNDEGNLQDTLYILHQKLFASGEIRGMKVYIVMSDSFQEIWYLIPIKIEGNLFIKVQLPDGREKRYQVK